MVVRDPDDIEPLRVAVEAAIAIGLETDDVQPAVELLQKLDKEQQPLAFTDIRRQDMEALQATKSRDRAVSILMRCMELTLDHGFQDEILTEFHYQNFVFCQRSNFSAEKASTFLSIMKRVHQRSIVQEKLEILEARKYFEGLMAKHSQQLPPFRSGIFSKKDVDVVRDHVNKSFFRHYKMYAFMYTQRRDLSVRAVDVRISPDVPKTNALHKIHEVDPREVPDLKDLFS